MELFVNNNIEFYDGLTFLIEVIDKNIFFLKSGDDICVEDVMMVKDRFLNQIFY